MLFYKRERERERDLANMAQMNMCSMISFAENYVFNSLYYYFKYFIVKEHIFLDCTVNLTFPVLEIQGQLKKINKVVIVGKQTKASHRVYFGKFLLVSVHEKSINLPLKPDNVCLLKVNI